MAGTRSGYSRTISLTPEDVDFVEKPPKQLQIECPICFGLLDTPTILSCCGWHFCETCIRPIIEEGKPCPMCKGKFSSLVNKSLMRDINQLEVRCPNKGSGGVDKGCPWIGELGKVEAHLNPFERFGECLFASVGCIYGCGHHDARSKLPDHETTLCPKRPYSCDYCNNYESTCEDVTERHWRVCEMYPIPCPNECKLRYLVRGKLSEHLAEECELEEVPCPFIWAGCTSKVRRCDLTTHLDSECTSHLILVCKITNETNDEVTHLNKTVTELYEAKSEAIDKIAALQSECKQQKAQIQELTSMFSSLTSRLEKVEQENAFLKQQIVDSTKRITSLESGVGVPPFSFTMDQFSGRRANKVDWLSPPFYSHLHGYRMCIRVSPNGLVIGEGTHISLTVHLMQGFFDDHLQWPFRGNIRVALCNQLRDSDHHVDTISFHKKASAKASGRVMTGEMNPVGIVSYEFFDHAFLKSDPKQRTNYLVEDSLQFRVLSVDVTVL